MSTSCMPPPPSPLAHRRSRPNTNVNPPASPPYSPESSRCTLRKMSLPKGATFHVPSSPPAEDDPVLSIRHLARRSPTCSCASLSSLISDKKDIAALSIQDFEQTFSGARGKRSSTRRRSSHESRAYRSASLHTDEGLGSSVSPSSEKGLAGDFQRSLDLESDSGLGTSIGDGSTKERAATRDVFGHTSEEDGLVQDLIQGWLARCALMNEASVDTVPTGTDLADTVPLPTRQRGTPSHPSVTRVSRSAVTHSISPRAPAPRQPQLSSHTRRTLTKNIIEPILLEDRFEFFHPLVNALASKHNKAIGCLRDLEQSLIFQPLVSSHHSADCPLAYQVAPKTLAPPRHLYRSFSEFSIQLVLDTYQHLSESEQRRRVDRPYDNGYFLDLVQQVGRLAAQIGRARQAKLEREPADEDPDDEMVYSPYVSPPQMLLHRDSHRHRDDEISLEGGLAQTGDLVELVRWHKGKAISLRTNLPYEPSPGIKRQHSGDELDDDVARSMARRKKGVEYKPIERKCSDKSCGKIFLRQCDLAKHEKTHSRPFKCPEPACKYHLQGLPTEKERDRHINDKHSSDPHYFQCEFCEFKTKRDSNCKQHMEKKHNWTYERVKGASKVVRTPGQTPQTPSLDYSPSAPSPAQSYLAWDDGSSVSGSVAGSVVLTPHEPSNPSFNGYPTAPYVAPLFPRQPTPSYMTANENFAFSPATTFPTYPHHGYQPYASPAHTAPMTPYMSHTPVTPAYSEITNYNDAMNIEIDYNKNNTGLPTPSSNYLRPHSRNPSMSHQSPMMEWPAEHVQEPSFIPAGMTSDGFASHSQLPMDDFALFDEVQMSSTANTGAFFPSMNDMDEPTYNCEDDSVLDDYLQYN